MEFVLVPLKDGAPDKEALKGELEESVEMMDVRISSLERQESSLKERYQSLQETINAAMGNMPRQ